MSLSPYLSVHGYLTYSLTHSLIEKQPRPTLNFPFGFYRKGPGLLQGRQEHTRTHYTRRRLRRAPRTGLCEGPYGGTEFGSELVSGMSQ